MKRIALLLIICSTFLSACSSSQWARTSVAKEYDYVVTLEQHQGHETNSLQTYEHPYEIALADLETLMEGLTYSDKIGQEYTEKQNRVFQAIEIDRMAPALTEALATANTNQRVRFTSFNLGKAAVFSVSQKTEGVLFVETDGRLNIAFNFINTKRSPSESSAVYHSYSKVDPLSIKSSDTIISAAAPYVESRKLKTGEQAPMWIATDLDALKKEVIVAEALVVEATEETTPVVAARTEHVAAANEKTAEPQDPVETKRTEIKKQLRFLKDLQDEGLISEQDYNAKKMEVLNKID